MNDQTLSPHRQKLAILQQRFPNARISSGYIGNIWQNGRDDRVFRIFTDILDEHGDRVCVPMPSGEYDFDLEEVTLFLQDRLVHRRSYEAMDLSRCPCSACFVARVRKRIEEGSSPIRVTEVTDELLKRVAADWTQFAGEPVRIEHIKGMIYGFCSELGALRIEHRYNLPRKRGRAQKSATEGWVYVLEI